MKVGLDRTYPAHDAGGFVPLVQMHRWGLGKKIGGYRPSKRYQNSGQISIIPKPELRPFWGDSLTKLPFGVTSAEAVINCPENWWLFSFTHLKLSMLLKNWVKESSLLQKNVVPKLKKIIFQHLICVNLSH